MDKQTKNIYNKWKKIEDKFGITAWEEIREVLWKQQQMIQELTKSRENWRNKYMRLKNGK